MAIGRSIYYKERSWNDFHIYSSKVLTGGVKIVQPSVYHEQRGEYQQFTIQITMID